MASLANIAASLDTILQAVADAPFAFQFTDFADEFEVIVAEMDKIPQSHPLHFVWRAAYLSMYAAKGDLDDARTELETFRLSVG